MIIVVLLESLD